MADHNTLQRITEVWESMSGGPEGWLKTFGYEQFALAIIAEFVPQSDEEPVGRAYPLAGSEGGFTMCVWRSSEVPIGTPVYAHQAVAKTALDSFIDDVEAADIRDAARYREFFASGLPITFLGVEYRTKAELDAAIDAVMGDQP